VIFELRGAFGFLPQSACFFGELFFGADRHKKGV
jgi:hypothetical protein